MKISVLQSTTKTRAIVSLAAAVLLKTAAASQAAALYIPTQNPNERVVAVTTPQAYGAKGDGVTDDTLAFQNALNAVNNPGVRGGGVLYVPAGHYAFYGNLSIPKGVTMHGDWKDWTTGGGAAGTIFDIYTTGAADGTPFLSISVSAGIKGITFWYPNQNAASIQPYPFTIKMVHHTALQNVILVNSYQGIDASKSSTGGSCSVISSVIGSPLLTGYLIDQTYDITHGEDIRFSPSVWSSSGLPGAPAAGGPHATWMRANGTALRLWHVDGMQCNLVNISGYKVGIDAETGVDGKAPGANFYQGSVSNCGTAFMANEMPGQTGFQFTWFTLDGDTGVDRTSTHEANVKFYGCTITGRTGPAVHTFGPGSTHSWMQFQNCAINGTIRHDGGDLNMVNCDLTTGSGVPQCTIASANVVRAVFIGCTFSPAQNIVNNNPTPARLIIESRPSIPNKLPLIDWATVKADYQSRKAAKSTLFVATAAGYGAVGDGSHDDTANIQSALDAAGTNGGGIVYLPGGHYKTTNTLTVPSGVELRGVYELRHAAGPWDSPGYKCKASVIQPYQPVEETHFFVLTAAA